jgi:hypothetical protein
MGAHCPQGQPQSADRLEQARPPLALALGRLGEGLRAAGADLDLGGDQLPRRRFRQHLVPLAGGEDVLEAVLQLQRLRVEDRELLLEPDREVL